MKLIILILTLLISSASYAQTEKSFFDNGQLANEIIQLDNIPDAHRHIIIYYENGKKKTEFFDKNRIIYDTLKQWTETGRLHHIEAYNDSGYTSIDYWYETGKILEIGSYTIQNRTPQHIIIDDSTNFNRYTTADCDKPCYIRAGIWKTYHENGTIESVGQYMPTAFNVSYPTKDSSNIMVLIKKNSFEIEGETGVVCLTFLKNGLWIYYDDKGSKTKEEVYANGLLKK